MNFMEGLGWNDPGSVQIQSEKHVAMMKEVEILKKAYQTLRLLELRFSRLNMGAYMQGDEPHLQRRQQSE